MIKERIKHLTFFKKFLLSYLFILLIPLVISSYAFNQAQTIVKNDSIDSRLYMLRQLKESVDKYISNVDETVVTNIFENKLNRLIYYNKPTEGAPDMFWFYDYARSQKFVSLKNDIFDSSYYIFLKNSEAIFTGSMIDFGLENYYDNNFNYSFLSYEQWYDLYFSSYRYKKVIPASKMKIDGNEKTMITCLYSIPLKQNITPSGVVAVLFDESAINKVLRGVNIENKGFSYISDETGAVISASNDKIEPIQFGKDTKKSEGFFYKKISGQDMIVVYTKSSYNNWTYTAAIPVDAVMGNANYLNRIALIVAVISLLIGVMLSLFLSYSNSRIFKDIKKSLKEFFDTSAPQSSPQGKSSDYDIIYGGISALIVDNKEMQNSLHKQVKTLKTIFIDRLLNGEFDNRQNMETLSSHVGIRLNGNYFTVSIIRINPQGNILNPQILEELDVIRILLEDILKKNIGEYFLIRVLNENELAIITSLLVDSIEESKSITKNTLSKVREEFMSRYHIAPLCGIGSTYTDIMDIQYSFNEAKQALYYTVRNNLNNDTIIWYENISKEITLYYYPSELELKLINFAKSGNWEDLENALDKIYNENFVKNPITDSMRKLLFYDMQATLMKIVDEIQYRLEGLNHNYDLLSKESPEVFFTWIKETYHRICKFIIKNKKSHNITLKENILDFINNNYTDGNLSVCLVASHFKLSESYFSQFFKEQTGETFSSYLENLRIELACSLIKEGNLSVDQIAQKTGYNNTNSFRRAFKKVTGVVPSAFK